MTMNVTGTRFTSHVNRGKKTFSVIVSCILHILVVICRRHAEKITLNLPVYLVIRVEFSGCSFSASWDEGSRSSLLRSRLPLEGHVIEELRDGILFDIEVKSLGITVFDVDRTFRDKSTRTCNDVRDKTSGSWLRRVTERRFARNNV